MGTLSKSKGIPMAHLKLAKKMGAPGFDGDKPVKTDLFLPWYEANKQNLVKDADDSLEYYKKEIAKRDVIIRDETIKKLKKESLDPADVKQFFNRVEQSQKVVFDDSFRDFKSKYPHLAKEIDSIIIDICNTFQGETTKWIN